MDIETLNQCLQYVQLTRPKSDFDKFIPLIGALCGAVVGGSITYFITRQKDQRSEKNKLTCCMEDVGKIQDSTDSFIKELMGAMQATALKQDLVRHRLPYNISPLCLGRYFTDIAHVFNREQRSWIQEVMSDLESVNEKIPKIISRKDVHSPYDYSVLLLNASAAAINASKVCRKIISGKELVVGDAELFNEIGCTNDQVSYRGMLIKNIDNNNNFLGL